MRSGSGALLPLVLLGFLAALTFWLKQAAQLGDFGDGAKQRHDPDFYVEQFSIRRYGEDGALLDTLVADKMLHFPDDDSTDVVAPRLTYQGQEATVVTANNAWLDKEGKHVRMTGDVRVVQSGGGDKPDTVMTTSVLYVTPDDKYAHTDAPVTITQGQTVVNGNGGSIDDKAKVAVLSGRVRGTIYRKQVQ